MGFKQNNKQPMVLDLEEECFSVYKDRRHTSLRDSITIKVFFSP